MYIFLLCLLQNFEKRGQVALLSMNQDTTGCTDRLALYHSSIYWINTNTCSTLSMSIWQQHRLVSHSPCIVETIWRPTDLEIYGSEIRYFQAFKFHNYQSVWNANPITLIMRKMNCYTDINYTTKSGFPNMPLLFINKDIPQLKNTDKRTTEFND